MKTANELFEELAERFYKETGVMAPGKDDFFGSKTYEERIKRWDHWNNQRNRLLGKDK